MFLNSYGKKVSMDSVNWTDSLGMYHASLGDVTLLSRARERYLIRKINAHKDGDCEIAIDAMKELAYHNTRLAMSEAKNYTNTGIPHEDLVQQANLGLMEAVNTAEDRENRFSTYATYRIKWSILDALYHQRGEVRVPKDSQIKANRIRGYLNCGGNGNVKEMVKDAGISMETLEKAIGALSANEGAVSMDNFNDVFKVDGRQHEEAETSERLGNVLRAIETLPERDREIIERRYGLNGYTEENNAEIGRRLNLGRERIRQILGESLERVTVLFNRYNYSSLYK
jgi:RNA polymerase sigma factor (sigma-70 family)